MSRNNKAAEQDWLRNAPEPATRDYFQRDTLPKPADVIDWPGRIEVDEHPRAEHVTMWTDPHGRARHSTEHGPAEPEHLARSA